METKQNIIAAAFRLETAQFNTDKDILLVQTFKNGRSSCFAGYSIRKMVPVDATFISNNTCFISPFCKGFKFYAHPVSVQSITPQESVFEVSTTPGFDPESFLNKD